MKKSFHDLQVGDSVRGWGVVLKVREVVKEERRRVVRWEEQVADGQKPKTYRGVWGAGLAYHMDEQYEVVEEGGDR